MPVPRSQKLTQAAEEPECAPLPQPEGFDGQHFTRCRNYQQTSEGPVCQRHHDRPECQLCRYCPRCAGLTSTDYREITYQRDGALVLNEKTCAICGAVYFSYQFYPRPTTRANNGQCSVDGCRSTLWTHRTIEVDGRKDIPVCESHYRQYRTWRNHGSKGEDQRPVVSAGDKYIENPRYKNRRQYP